MGLFDKIQESVSSSEESDEEGTDGAPQVEMGISFDIKPPEDSLDPEYLQEIIIEHYDVYESDAKVIAECIEEGHFEGYGYDKITRNAKEAGVEIEREQLHTIVWTELGGIQTRRNIADSHEKVTESDFIMGVEWSVPDDERSCSPVCEATAAEIEDRGGAVPVPELQRILKANAEEFDDGTPERMDDWIPHEECRCTVMTVFE